MRSRYARGRPSASAMAFRETGPPTPAPARWRPSSTSRRTPYSAFVVKITGEILPRESENPSGLCASSQPLRQTDPVELISRLDQLRHRVEEARAAAQVIADGDPTAMQELDAEVDAMAEDVAALKAMTSGPPT